jgi:hypothetical protein
MKHGSFLAALVCATACAFPPAFGQLPTAQLTSVFPPGGKQGSAVEVTVAGADLDDLEKLVFNHPGLSAVAKMIAATELEPTPRPVPNQFTVKIAADVPPGVYEARAAGRFGLSNPRSFAVGVLNELTDGGGNNAAEKAVEVAIGSTVNGRVEANNYDFFRLNLKSGERVLIDVAAERLDSRLDGTLVLLGPDGNEIAREKGGIGADPVLDFTAPAAGAYTLKLHDAVYGGGEPYFYRMTVSAAPFVDFVFPPCGPAGSSNQYTLYGRNLPGGQLAEGLSIGGVPLQKLPVIIPLPAGDAPRCQLAVTAGSPLKQAWQDAIAFRLPTIAAPANPVPIYFSKSPTVVVEQEPNGEPKSAQKVAIPCEYAGQFYPQRDSDWVEFEAKKGQTYWIEVISSQLGLDSDPAFTLFRVTKNDKGEEQMSEIAQVDDTPERTRQIGADYDATSDDPAYKFVVPDDGAYRLLVRDQFGDGRKDPSFVYRLSIRTPDPDFRLLAYPVSPPANQQQANLTPLASACVRKGGAAAIGLSVQRRDEYAGEIAVSVEGLPPGVICSGAVLGGTADEGALVLVAAEDASNWAGPIKVIAKGKDGDKEVVREARYGVAVWGSPNRQQQPGEFRLAPCFSLGVIGGDMEPALVRIGEDKVYETALGGSVELPIKLDRRGDFKDAVKLVAMGVAQPMKPKDVTLAADAKEGKLEITLNQQNLKPGAYTFYLRGESKRSKYARNPDAISAAEAEQKRLAEMLAALASEVKSTGEAKDEAAHKASQEKLKEAEKLKTQADKRLDEAKKANQPKDVNFALVSTPIRLRVHASPFKITSAAMAGPIKPAEKQQLSVQFERLYGMTGDVELLFDPPAGVKGLPAQKVAVAKDQSDGKLEIAAEGDATPGEHACTLRVRGKFNNVQVETSTQVTVTIAKTQ